jgi:putative hemolysin
MRVGCQRHAPASLPSGQRLGTHCTRGWVSPRAGLDACGKSLPSPGFDPRTVQPVVSRYTDCAIPAYSYCADIGIT